MEKFKSWIKQPVNFNFFVISIISALLLVIAVIFGIVCTSFPLDGPLCIFGAIGLAFALIFAVICPAIIGIISEILAVIAKKVHKKGKITAYRVLMTLCYINFFIPAIIVIFFCLAEIGWPTVLLILYNIAELMTLIITMKNTYSKRILN